MIATRAQKKREPAELLESETEPENLEKSNRKQTRKSKTNLDKDIEDPLELDEPDNNLPFQSVPECEMVPSERLENERCETHIEPKKHVPVYKTHVPVEDLELDDLLDRILKADVTVKLGTLLKSVKEM